MTTEIPHSLQLRVEQAAKSVLARNGSVGPLELFQELRWLVPSHVEAWQRGVEEFQILQRWIQVGPAKFQKAVHHFQAWIHANGLRPLEAPHIRRGPGGIEHLQVTTDGNPEGEAFYRTHYVPADLPEKKTARLKAKLNRAPDLVVFQKVSEAGQCSECGGELQPGDRLLMEKGRPLCLSCADLDHLVFLSAGDMALTRRARKHSPLSAVVVRFNRSRRRYERQGLLVAEAALARAETECAADAPERAVARARATGVRTEEDREFVDALTEAIIHRYPGCPSAEARRIAEHTGLRSSGRVGRSAAGRALDATAMDLSVIAHIRHEHTNYDELLMGGTERLEARAQVREKIDHVLSGWADG
jgi:hypothetical protein